MAGNKNTIQISNENLWLLLCISNIKIYCFSSIQMDMHELIDEHMKKQLHDSLAIKESSVTSVTKKPNRFMGLFQQFQFQR